MLRRFRHALDVLLDRPVKTDVRVPLALAARVREARSHLRTVGDDDVARRFCECRRLAAAGRDGTIVTVLALVSEAAHRTLGLEAFDSQLAGAAILSGGAVAEMPTGEGKTLTAVFAACLHALAERGCHVLTANDYLARRDAAWMGPVYGLLGLSAGAVQSTMRPDDRTRAYGADVTYGTATEVGFDYLRDHLVERRGDLVQRGFHAAIVDEIDAILIDEARVPLVIAGGSDDTDPAIVDADRVVRSLRPAIDYDTDGYGRLVYLTDDGIARAEELLGVANLYDEANATTLAALNLALHAHVLLRRDVDYVVASGGAELVDALKGRVAHRRRWPDGLQAAVELKEGVPVTAEARVLSTITLQSLIRLYPSVCGMTATARESAGELRELYGLETVVVPPHRPCARVDLPDVVFTSKVAKERAVVDEVKMAQAAGRPVLVGTASVEDSERLAEAVRSAGMPCRVLNARDDEAEAAIIAEAGSPGAVTVSTNMAGRGTDIRLGGTREERRDEVARSGGLYVIGTNRHESSRIDRQLRGRAGRQGDPGSSRFFVSLEDDLVVRYGIGRYLARLGAPDHSGRIDGAHTARVLDRAQELVDALNAQLRINLSRYTALVEKQRRIAHRRREDVLLADDIDDPRRIVTLAVIDRTWADHLADLRDVREGIALRMHPEDEYVREAVAKFDGFFERIDAEVAEVMRSLDGADGVDLARHGLERPSATWTYLQGDTPADRSKDSWLERSRKVLERVLAEE